MWRGTGKIASCTTFHPHTTHWLTTIIQGKIQPPPRVWPKSSGRLPAA